jgi:hypothetical protein
MRFNFWLVALLAVMPLFILVVGLAAAAGGLDSPTLWILVAAAVGAGIAAARLAGRGPEERH